MFVLCTCIQHGQKEFDPAMSRTTLKPEQELCLLIISIHYKSRSFASKHFHLSIHPVKVREVRSMSQASYTYTNIGYSSLSLFLYPSTPSTYYIKKQLLFAHTQKRLKKWDKLHLRERLSLRLALRQQIHNFMYSCYISFIGLSNQMPYIH